MIPTAGQPAVCLCCKQRFAFARGNCAACYSRHQYQIAKGLTTWEALQAQGKAAPRRGRSPNPWGRHR
jgi:hypothetical protein